MKSTDHRRPRNQGTASQTGSGSATRYVLEPPVLIINPFAVIIDWTAFYAATLLDGSAGTVQHWAGEVER